MGGMSEGDRITRPQRAALEKLAPVLGQDFYLVGGVAVAAHLGHRTSRDLDLFATRDPNDLRPQLDHIPGVKIKSRAPGTLHLQVDEIPVSLIEYRYPLLAVPSARASLPVPVASIEDLACMKLSAITGRGAARDFWDLHTIVTRTGRSLLELLGAFQRKYPIENIGHVLRSLVYFGDAEGLLPEGLSPSHWQQIQADFQTWVQASFRAE